MTLTEGPTLSAGFFSAEPAFQSLPSEAPVPGMTAPSAFFSATAADPTLSAGFFLVQPAFLSPPSAYYEVDPTLHACLTTAAGSISAAASTPDTT